MRSIETGGTDVAPALDLQLSFVPVVVIETQTDIRHANLFVPPAEDEAQPTACN